MGRILVALAGVASVAEAAKLTVASPSIFAGDLTTNATLTVHGSGFAATKATDVITCHVRGGLSGWVKPDLARPNEMPAVVVSDTEVACSLPPVPVALDAIVEIWRNHDSNFSEGTNASFKYRHLVEATPSKRPFVGGEARELLVWADAEAVRAHDAATTAVEVCRSVSGGAKACDTVAVDGATVAVPLGVAFEGDATLDVDVVLLPSRVPLATKPRRLLSVADGGEGSTVAVDHKRRAARHDRSCFLSQSRLEFTKDRPCRPW